MERDVGLPVDWADAAAQINMDRIEENFASARANYEKLVAAARVDRPFRVVSMFDEVGGDTQMEAELAIEAAADELFDWYILRTWVVAASVYKDGVINGDVLEDLVSSRNAFINLANEFPERVRLKWEDFAHDFGGALMSLLTVRNTIGDANVGDLKETVDKFVEVMKAALDFHRNEALWRVVAFESQPTSENLLNLIKGAFEKFSGGEVTVIFDESGWVDENIVIQADPVLLDIVWLNVIKNAMRYVLEDGLKGRELLVHLAALTRSVQEVKKIKGVKVVEEFDEVCFVVADEGDGFPEGMSDAQVKKRGVTTGQGFGGKGIGGSTIAKLLERSGIQFLACNRDKLTEFGWGKGDKGAAYRMTVRFPSTVTDLEE